MLVVSVRSAAGQPAAAADEAFQRGREALKVGNYVVACAAFEDSQRLDPQLTTQFNLALCDEQLGKLASALAIHKELAIKDDNLPRRAKAADMVTELEGRVARLRIDVAKVDAQLPPGPKMEGGGFTPPPGPKMEGGGFTPPPGPKMEGGGFTPPPGIEVTVNGLRATNFKDMPIDLGVSHVVAHAPGFIEWRGDVTAKDERQKVVITVAFQPVASTTPVSPIEPPSVPRDEPSSMRTRLGVAGMVVGGVTFAGGVTYGLLARSKWNQAKDLCGGTTCATQEAVDRGNDLVHEARKRGTISTALFVGGGLIAGAGVILWVTAPKAERSVVLVPAASTSSVGVALFGRY